MQKRVSTLIGIIIIIIAIIILFGALFTYEVFFTQNFKETGSSAKLITGCMKENESCGFYFGRPIGNCCGGLKCILVSNIPDAGAKCEKVSTFKFTK